MRKEEETNGYEYIVAHGVTLEVVVEMSIDQDSCSNHENNHKVDSGDTDEEYEGETMTPMYPMKVTLRCPGVIKGTFVSGANGERGEEVLTGVTITLETDTIAQSIERQSRFVVRKATEAILMGDIVPPPHVMKSTTAEEETTPISLKPFVVNAVGATTPKVTHPVVAMTTFAATSTTMTPVNKKDRTHFAVITPRQAAVTPSSGVRGCGELPD
eukprot:2645757-Ditylum_brightwellii.AAC.1